MGYPIIGSRGASKCHGLPYFCSRGHPMLWATLFVLSCHVRSDDAWFRSPAHSIRHRNCPFDMPSEYDPQRGSAHALCYQTIPGSEALPLLCAIRVGHTKGLRSCHIIPIYTRCRNLAHAMCPLNCLTKRNCSCHVYPTKSGQEAVPLPFPNHSFFKTILEATTSVVYLSHTSSNCNGSVSQPIL